GTGNAKGRVENGVGDVKKNCLAGLDLPDFSALHPAARQWLETVANVRLPGATRHKPTALWHPEKSALHPLPMHPFAIATVSQVRASRQCRLPLDTHRSSVPAHLAGHALTLQTSPDRLCLSLGEHLIARHVRSDDRYGDFEDPEHPKPLLAPRKKARAHQLFMRFLALSPRAATPCPQHLSRYRASRSQRDRGVSPHGAQHRAAGQGHAPWRWRSLAQGPAARLSRTALWRTGHTGGGPAGVPCRVLGQTPRRR